MSLKPGHAAPRAALGTRVILFESVPTSSTYSNNLFYGINNIYINTFSNTYAQASSALGFTSSTFGTNPNLVNYTAIPPRFWSDASLPAPSPLQSFSTLIALYN